MTAAGNLVIQGNITNTPTGQLNFGPLTITAGNAIGESVIQALSVGANTLVLPVGITSLVIMGPNSASPAPNPSYGGKISVGGVGDTIRIPIAAGLPTILSWDSTAPAPASIVLNATVATSVQLWML